MKTFLLIVSQPSIIIALVTFLGLLFQKNKPSKLITGTIMSFMGFTMIKAGSGILSGVLTYFSQIFSHAFHLTGIVPSNEAMMAMTLGKLGSTAALMLALALVLNILIARFTRFKNIYLSLQLVIFMAFAVTAVLTDLNYGRTITIVIGAIFIGLYMAIMPYLLRRYTRDVVGNDEYTIAHSGSVAYFIGSWLGSRFGNKANDTEDIKLNDSILFLKNPNVATTLTMFILFLVSGLFAGTAYVSKLADGANFWVFIMEQSAIFASGLFIVKAGVKLFIEEIVPAFKGFAKVFAPGVCVKF